MCIKAALLIISAKLIKMKNLVLLAGMLAVVIALQSCGNNKKITAGKNLQSENVFTPEQMKLNGTWELNYISGLKIAFNGLYPGKKPSIVFNLPGMEAVGNSGCNNFRSRIKLDSNKINFANPLSTMMFCEGGGEQAFFNTLKKITSFSVTDNTLTLIMDDIAMMRFAKK